MQFCALQLLYSSMPPKLLLFRAPANYIIALFWGVRLIALSRPPSTYICHTFLLREGGNLEDSSCSCPFKGEGWEGEALSLHWSLSILLTPSYMRTPLHVLSTIVTHLPIITKPSLTYPLPSCPLPMHHQPSLTYQLPAPSYLSSINSV